MKTIAMLALLTSVLACRGNGGPNVQMRLMNATCECESGSLCMQKAGDEAAPISCVAATTCASLSTPSRTCWGSPRVSGLCTCLDAATQMAAK